MQPQDIPFMDRRKYTRLSSTVVVRCARLGLPAAAGAAEPHWSASTVDLSEGGVLLRTAQRLRLGEGLELLFELNPAGKPLRVTGNVVRYHSVMYDKIYYIPVAFTALTAAARDQIKAFISHNASSE